jgi:hypothetical protein
MKTKPDNKIPCIIKISIINLKTDYMLQFTAMLKYILNR